VNPINAAAIRAAVEDAQPPDPAALIRAEVARLTTLDGAAYLAERRMVARRLNVPVGALDGLVNDTRASAASRETRQSLAPPPPAPWPEPVDARDVLDEVCTFIARFIMVDEHALLAIALWIGLAHCFDAAETSPRLAILSPTKRCGKTRLLELLALLCPRAIAASNLTPSAVFRTIDAEACTLLVDEADTFMRGNDELRGLLNCGHTRAAAFVIRPVPRGDKAWEPRKFSTCADCRRGHRPAGRHVHGPFHCHLDEAQAALANCRAFNAPQRRRARPGSRARVEARALRAR